MGFKDIFGCLSRFILQLCIKQLLHLRFDHVVFNPFKQVFRQPELVAGLQEFRVPAKGPFALRAGSSSG